MNNDAHQIEAELLQPPPRKIKRRGGKRTIAVWMRGFCALLFVLALYFLKNAVFTTLISFSSATVPARVTDLHISKSRSNYFYGVGYDYKIGGTVRSDQQDVGFADFQATQIGELVSVQFLPAAPSQGSRLRLPNGHIYPTRLSDWAYFLLGSGLVLTFGAKDWILWRRARTLTARGVPVTGRITRKENLSSSRLPCFQLHYVYSPHGGTNQVSHSFSASTPDLSAAPELEGEMEITEEDYKTVKKGDIVTVLHDARKPKRSLIYRYAEYQCAE